MMAAKSSSKAPAQSSPPPEALGFGFIPTESQHHFLVYPRPKSKDVVIFECTEYRPDEDLARLLYSINDPATPCRCILSKARWDEIEATLRQEFNQRLRRMGFTTSSFGAKDTTYLHRLFGKELLVLAWASEDADITTLGLACQNWQGLRPEERWWLFTMTNAATGNALSGKGKGWRKALRYALTENPVTNGSSIKNYDITSPSLFASEPGNELFF